jgi:hypothetical protein
MYYYRYQVSVFWRQVFSSSEVQGVVLSSSWKQAQQTWDARFDVFLERDLDGFRTK